MANATQSKGKRTKRVLTDAERATARKVKAAKFVELAQKRMTNALMRLRQLETLGKYPHDDVQTNTMMKALEDAVAAVKRALSSREQKTFDGFVLTPFDETPAT